MGDAPRGRVGFVRLAVGSCERADGQNPSNGGWTRRPESGNADDVIRTAAVPTWLIVLLVVAVAMTVAGAALSIPAIVQTWR